MPITPQEAGPDPAMQFQLACKMIDRELRCGVRGFELASRAGCFFYTTVTIDQVIAAYEKKGWSITIEDPYVWWKPWTWDKRTTLLFAEAKSEPLEEILP